jgi:hypothetical protein
LVCKAFSKVFHQKERLSQGFFQQKKGCAPTGALFPRLLPAGKRLKGYA